MHNSGPNAFKNLRLNKVNDSSHEILLEKWMAPVKSIPQILSPPPAGGDKGEGEDISN
jgi:hypothetical protein